MLNIVYNCEIIYLRIQVTNYYKWTNDDNILTSADCRWVNSELSYTTYISACVLRIRENKLIACSHHGWISQII